MKRMIYKTAIFSIPFVLWFAAVLIIDPFNYFAVSSVISRDIKLTNAKSLNRLLFNMIEYSHDPSENLLIGDSRSNHLKIEYIESVTGDDYFQLNSNALKLNEAFQLYWFASRIRQPKRVYFTLNFNLYNEFAFADRVSSVEMILNNPLLYIFNRSVAETCYLCTKAAIQGRNAVSSLPPMTRDEFWEWNIRVKANDHYGKYEYPEELYREMERVVEDAEGKGTEVVFIIVPHHVDMQGRVADYGLTDEMIRFKKDVFSLGTRVYDYDFVNEISLDRKMFDDPLHFTPEAGNMIIDEVWGGKHGIGRLMTEAYVDSLESSASGDSK